MTRVLPKDTRTEPWACGAMFFSMVTGRIWRAGRWSCRVMERMWGRRRGGGNRFFVRKRFLDRGGERG
jgi:hypothetical protein